MNTVCEQIILCVHWSDLLNLKPDACTGQAEQNLDTRRWIQKNVYRWPFSLWSAAGAEGFE